MAVLPVQYNPTQRGENHGLHSSNEEADGEEAGKGV